MEPAHNFFRAKIGQKTHRAARVETGAADFADAEVAAEFLKVQQGKKMQVAACDTTAPAASG